MRKSDRLSRREQLECLQTEAPTVFGKLFLRNVCTYFSGNEGVENHIFRLSLTHTHTQTAPDDASDVFQISNFKDHFEHSHFTLIDSLSFVSAPPSHDFSDTSFHCS